MSPQTMRVAVARKRDGRVQLSSLVPLTHQRSSEEMKMEYDHSTPYGHVPANARPEARLLVRVVVRPGHMGQMLNDGRA